jgi:hypothetical protein
MENENPHYTIMETPQRTNWRFRVPVKVWAKLEAADLSIFESKFKRVATSLEDDEQAAYVYVQFSTQNCGRTIAIQRLAACLIETLS